MTINAHEQVVQQVREAIPPSYLHQADGYLFRAIEAMVRHIDELEARDGAYGRDVERQVAHENAQKLERAEARVRELEAQVRCARVWWENCEIDPELGPLGVILGAYDMGECELRELRKVVGDEELERFLKSRRQETP